ncbi:MAG: methylated-DNA--[protein]-cysteine S-methyltransferase [Bacillota bacterium]|jgi:methylated-DNA-[protein]-cysteine S-methyltransferase
MALQWDVYETDLGWIGAAFSAVGLRLLTLPQKTEEEAICLLQKTAQAPLGKRCTPSFAAELAEDLLAYAQGEELRCDLPLDLTGLTAFQRSVLNVLRQVAFGQLTSYGELARAAGYPGAARAVGQVMANNPLPLVIPCHRVLRSDGSLGGFGGGPEMKQRLLRLEGVEVEGR